MTDNETLTYEKYLATNGIPRGKHGSIMVLLATEAYQLLNLPDGPKHGAECLPYLNPTLRAIAQEAINRGLQIQLTDRSAPWQNSYGGSWDFSLDLVSAEDLANWK